MHQNNLLAVELDGKLWTYTNISPENHAALRSGFAGYPANPRWNVYKYSAWKQGCRWRKDLSQGTLVVSESDHQLVPVEATIAKQSKDKHNSLKWRGNEILNKRILISS